MVTRDLVPISKETLTPAEFNAFSDIPPELEWLANITNPKTSRAYKVDVAEFLAFSGFSEINSLRNVARSHVIARRKEMEAGAWLGRASGASSPRCHRCLIISASAMLSLSIPSMASSARRR